MNINTLVNQNETPFEVDKKATLDRIRVAYDSIPKFAQACEVTPKLIYLVVNKHRGQVRKQSQSRAVWNRMKKEGLLVLREVSNERQ